MQFSQNLFPKSVVNPSLLVVFYANAQLAFYLSIMQGIKSFFGYLFIMLAGLLTVTQIIIFPFADADGVASGLGGGRLFLLFLLTVGSVIGGFLALDAQEDIWGRKIATFGALGLAFCLIIAMAFFVLSANLGVNAWEYFILFFYMMVFGIYGFIGSGAL